MNKSTEWVEIAEWGSRYPVLLTWLAVTQFKLANEVYEITRFLRNEKGAPEAERDFPIGEWLECYRDPSIAVRGSLSAMGVELPGQPSKFQLELSEETNRQLKAYDLDLANPKTARGAMDAMHRIIMETWYEDDISEAASFLEELETAKEEFLNDDASCESIALSVHCRFYIEVIMPCMIEYQEPPERLFKKATNGDLQALEKILTVDKWAAALPEWLEKIYAKKSTDAKKARQINARVLKKPAMKQRDIGSTKIEIASQVCRTFESVGLSIDVRQVRELFNIFAKHELGVEYDPHLPTDNLNFATHLRRGKKRWKNYFPDVSAEIRKALSDCQKRRSPKPSKKTGKRAA